MHGTVGFYATKFSVTTIVTIRMRFKAIWYGPKKFTIRSNLENRANNPFRSSWERVVAPSFGTTASTCPALALAFVVAVPLFGTLATAQK